MANYSFPQTAGFARIFLKECRFPGFFVFALPKDNCLGLPLDGTYFNGVEWLGICCFVLTSSPSICGRWWSASTQPLPGIHRVRCDAVPTGAGDFRNYRPMESGGLETVLNEGLC